MWTLFVRALTVLCFSPVLFPPRSPQSDGFRPPRSFSLRTPRNVLLGRLRVFVHHFFHTPVKVGVKLPSTFALPPFFTFIPSGQAGVTLDPRFLFPPSPESPLAALRFTPPHLVRPLFFPNVLKFVRFSRPVYCPPLLPPLNPRYHCVSRPS